VYGKPGGLRTVDYKDAGELEIGKDGVFKIQVSRKPPSKGNWLKLAEDPEQALLIVRQTFGDRNIEQPAQLTITRILQEGEEGADSQTDEPVRPEYVTARAIDEALSTSGLFVAGASMMFARWAKEFQVHSNQLPLFDVERSNKAGGDPKIRYYHSHWRLLPGEALIIRAQPPECNAWNFQLNNYWMESLDYR
jgi:hypothetical protein